MQDSITNGMLSSAGIAAGREDQDGVAGLGFVAGGRAVPMGSPGAERVPDPELVAQARRRSFTAEYKARILAEADAASQPGEVGALLRREGLYTSHLTYWRKQRKEGALKELGKPRGRPPVDRRDQEIVALKRKLERSESELQTMRRVVEIQGNVSALLEGMLGQGSAQRSTER
jgi:transposase